MNDSILIANFCGVTGADASEAKTWLEMSNFHLENAIELFFSNSSHQDQHSGYHHNLDPVLSDRPIETYDGVGNDSDNVRKPDSVKRGRLMDESYISTIQKAPRVSPSAFNSGGGQFGPRTEKEKTLANMFKPPTDLMTQATFDLAMESAKEQDKWLLVNLQRDSVFQCHALNRDFWADESVRDMVQCSFVFWQQMDSTDAGATYSDRYKVLDHPHIAIVDPRTGAAAWRHEGPFDAKMLSEKLQDYLGLHPAPSESHMGSRIMRKLSASAGGSSTRTSGSHNANSFSGSVCSSHVSSGSRGTEDEDLEHAIRLSLQQQHVVEENSKCSTEADPAEPVTAGISTSSILPGFAVSDYMQDSAPIAGSVGTGGDVKTQFRLPNNIRIQHAFSSTATVGDIARFAAAQLASVGPAAKDAELRFDLSYGYPQALLSEVRAASPEQRDLLCLAVAGVVSGTAFTVKLL